MLSPDTINELRQIIREDYGKEITTQEAEQMAYGLMGYFDLLKQICVEDELIT